MKPFEELFVDFEKAVKNLEDGVSNAKDDLEIDGVVKRFELSFELSWKIIKEYLTNIGLICKNPRECFKMAYQNGLLDDEQKWFEMIGTRNELVHIYTPEQSRKAFNETKERYLGSFLYLYNAIKRKM